MFPDRSTLHHQKGLGLPAALFVIVVLALLVVAITELERSTAEGVSISVLSTRAFYAAESGAQVAMRQLFPPGAAEQNCGAVSANHTFSVTGLNGCTATVQCSTDTVDGEDYYTIRSQGTCGSGNEIAQRAVEVRAH